MTHAKLAYPDPRSGQPGRGRRENVKSAIIVITSISQKKNSVKESLQKVVYLVGLKFRFEHALHEKYACI